LGRGSEAKTITFFVNKKSNGVQFMVVLEGKYKIYVNNELIEIEGKFSGNNFFDLLFQMQKKAKKRTILLQLNHEMRHSISINEAIANTEVKLGVSSRTIYNYLGEKRIENRLKNKGL